MRFANNAQHIPTQDARNIQNLQNGLHQDCWDVWDLQNGAGGLNQDQNVQNGTDGWSGQLVCVAHHC